MTYQHRLKRLEEQYRPASHHSPVVRVPREIARDGWTAYLNGLPCACGIRGCARRTIGAAVPQQLTVIEWDRTYNRCP